MTHLDIDNELLEVAARTGMDLVRRGDRVVIEEGALLPAEYKHMAPDYSKIRRALLSGIEVPGAHLESRTEYVLEVK